MSSGEFCPRCGDPVPERAEPLPGAPRDRDESLCNACYFEDFELVDAPERIEVLVCSSCGAVHRGNRWVDVDADDYTDVAIEEVSEALGVHVRARNVQWQVEPEQIDENTIRMHCHFSGTVRDTYVEESVVVPVMISRQTCDRCGRISGGYYSSEVQVRAEGRLPTSEEQNRAVEIAESYVAEREATGDRNAFITEVKETDDGVNVKISTNQLGQGVSNHIVRELGGDVESYPTLVTEDTDGNEVYRVTYAIRLPQFASGDIVNPDDGEGPVLVRSVRGNLKGVRLTTGEEYERKPDDADAERVGHVDDGEETTVVAVEDDHAVQVLDPETYASKTIARPDYFDPDAQTVRVFKSRTGLYVLPKDEA